MAGPLIATIGWVIVNSSDLFEGSNFQQPLVYKPGCDKCVSLQLVSTPAVYGWNRAVLEQLGIKNGSGDPSQWDGNDDQVESLIWEGYGKLGDYAVSYWCAMYSHAYMNTGFRGLKYIEQSSYAQNLGSLTNIGPTLTEWMANGDQIDKASGPLLGNQMKSILGRVSKDPRRQTIFASRVKYNAAFAGRFHRAKMVFHLQQQGWDDDDSEDSTQSIRVKAIYAIDYYKYGELPRIDAKFVGIPLQDYHLPDVTHAYFIVPYTRQSHDVFKKNLDSINVYELTNATNKKVSIFIPEFDVTSLSHDDALNHGYNLIQGTRLKMTTLGFGDPREAPLSTASLNGTDKETHFRARHLFGVLVVYGTSYQILISAVIDQPDRNCSNLFEVETTYAKNTNVGYVQKTQKYDLSKPGSFKCVSKNLVRSPVIFKCGGMILRSMGIVNGSYTPNVLRDRSKVPSFYLNECISRFKELSLSFRFGMISFSNSMPAWEGIESIEQWSYAENIQLLRSLSPSLTEWMADGEQIDQKNELLLGNQMKLFLDRLDVDHSTIFMTRVKYNAGFKSRLNAFWMNFHLPNKKFIKIEAIGGYSRYKYGELPKINAKFVGIPLQDNSKVTSLYAFFVIGHNRQPYRRVKQNLDSIKIEDLANAAEKMVGVILPTFDVTSLSHDDNSDYGYNHMQGLSLKMTASGFGDSPASQSVIETRQLNEMVFAHIFGVIVVDTKKADGDVIVSAVVDQPHPSCSNLIEI